MTDLHAKLREPFPTNTIKVKPQSVTQDQSKGLVTYYVDARIVAERLNEAVGTEGWSDEYKVLAPVSEGAPVECRLNLNGVTKTDVGQVKPGDLDDKTWKSAYSDAFKRAAVKFGVGAYLYESPNVWAETKIGHNGKAQGFSDVGRAHALAEYAKWIGDSAPGTGATQSAGGQSAVGETRPAAHPVAPPTADSQFQPPAGATASMVPGWTWPFGKHKGKTLAETDEGYLTWFLNNSDKEDIKQRVREFMALDGAQEFGSFVDGEPDIPFAPTVDGVN